MAFAGWHFVDVYIIYIYMHFLRSWLDYPDVIYDQAYNSAFHDKLEPVQCNASLAITVTLRNTPTEKNIPRFRISYIQALV